MKSKYYWLIGLGGVMSTVLLSGLASANWNNQNAAASPSAENGQLHHHDGQKHTDKKRHKKGHGFKSLFHAIDSDRDRQISLKEVNEMLKSRFSGLDADGNGQVSLEEFSNRHLSLFSAVDKNKDGAITREEIKQHRREKHHS